MIYEDLVKGLNVLAIAYEKKQPNGQPGFTKSECDTYYEFLQEYTYDTFKTAVKNIIKKSKFLPKISELVEECDNCKEQIKHEVIEFMWNSGYFKKGAYGEFPRSEACDGKNWYRRSAYRPYVGGRCRCDDCHEAFQGMDIGK